MQNIIIYWHLFKWNVMNYIYIYIGPFDQIFIESYCCFIRKSLPESVIEMTKRIFHDDVIKWKRFPRYWPFARGIHWSQGNFSQKGQWHGAWIFSLICTRINGWVNNRGDCDLRRHRAHYDVTAKYITISQRLNIICRMIAPVLNLTLLFTTPWRGYVNTKTLP